MLQWLEDPVTIPRGWVIALIILSVTGTIPVAIVQILGF